MPDLAELFDAAEPLLRPEFATSLRSTVLAELGDASPAAVAPTDGRDVRFVDASEARADRAALPRKRLIVAVAVAAALLVAVLVATSSHQRGSIARNGSPATSRVSASVSNPATAAVTPTTGPVISPSSTPGPSIPGPLLVQPDVATNPTPTPGSPTTIQPGSAALIDGVLTHDDLRDCYVVGGYLAVFPPGTRLQGGVVVLPGAREVPLGTHLRGSGAYVGVGDLQRIIGRSAGQCETMYREVAVFNPSIEVVGSSGEVPNGVAATTFNPGIVVATFDPMSAIELRPNVLAQDGRGYVYYSGGEFATEGRLVVADRQGFVDVAVPLPPSGVIGLGPDGVLYLVTGRDDAFSVVGVATRGVRAGIVVARSKSVSSASDLASLSCAVEASGISCGVGGVRQRVLVFDVDAGGESVAPMQHGHPSGEWRTRSDALLEPQRRSFDHGQVTCSITRSGEGNDPSGGPPAMLTIDCPGGVSDGPPPRQVKVLGAAGVPMMAWDDTGLWYLRNSKGAGPDQLVFLPL